MSCPMLLRLLVCCWCCASFLFVNAMGQQQPAEPLQQHQSRQQPMSGKLRRLRQTPVQYQRRKTQDDSARDLFLKQPTTNFDNDCPIDCPCCSSDLYPEFTRAVTGFDTNGGCYTRVDPSSDIIAILNCATNDEDLSPSRSSSRPAVAYFSFDYVQARGEAQYCGESGSDINPLTPTEAAACQNLLQRLVEQKGVVCNDSFECA